MRSTRVIAAQVFVAGAILWTVFYGWDVAPAQAAPDRASPARRAEAGGIAAVGGGGEAPKSSGSNASRRPSEIPRSIDEGSAAEAALPWVPRYQCNGTEAAGVAAQREDEYCAALNESIWSELLGASGNRLQASDELKRVLREYLEVARLVADGKEPEGQRYLVWSLSGGLGNRMQAMVSTFAAALLSNRVLLLKDWFTKTVKNGVPREKVRSTVDADLFAEDLSFLGTRGLPPNAAILCAAAPIIHLRDFAKLYPKYFAPKSAWATGHHVKVDVISAHDKHGYFWSKLACKAPAAFPSEKPVKFTYVWSNQYYLPIFWSNPETSRAMAAWFPSRDAFGPLSRFLIRPAQPVEAAAEAFVCARFHRASAPRGGVFAPQADAAAPRGADAAASLRAYRALPPGTHGRPAYLGLQLRAFRPKKMTEMAADADACLQEHYGKALEGGAPVYLASLHDPIRRYYEAKYKARVATVEDAARGEQETGSVEADREAFAAMLVLGRTADFFLSPGSTFGSFTAGYFGRRPVQLHTMGTRRCSRMTSSQPCFMVWRRTTFRRVQFHIHPHHASHRPNADD
eukprot:gene19106-29420_t